jgi:PAB-dependent poly(A)-specific ribonuclease subunit 3
MRERVLTTSNSRGIPEIVQHKYHSLLQLDAAEKQGIPEHSPVLGYRTAVYKALSTTDPYVYCLRRVDGFRLSNFDLVQDAIEKWSDIKHPNIVAVRQAFATSEFQDIEGIGEGGSLVYVYDYIDLAQTLEHWLLISNEMKLVSDALLWDIIVQASLGLRMIHSNGLAARCVHPSKILVSSRFRIHLNCVGLLDAIQHSLITHHTPGQSVADHQHEDFVNLAKIVLCLGLGIPYMELEKLSISQLIDTCSGGTLSPSLVEIIKALVSQSDFGKASAILAMCGSFVALKAEQLQSGQDMLMSELRKTVDGTRVQKILYKVCAIADRAHLLDDWRWSSTGDRYIVQLFRDYVFFQVDDTGRPFFDVGHVTDCLAKVDVGSFEPIMLMNRDASSVLVTNYHDIRRCIEASFKEIAEASAVVAPRR